LEYGYDSKNKRVWRGTLSGGVLTQTVYVYGTDGQLLGTYSFVQNGYQYADNGPTLSVFFAGKRIGISAPNQGTAGFVQDRLGSSGKYYPFGEARGTVPQDAIGFATYTNDSATGLEYADQRYYASNFGRFMSPDPYQAKARGTSDPTTPSTWNRYAYVINDPINFKDASGRFSCSPEDASCDPGDDCVDLWCQPEGSGGPPPPPPPAQPFLPVGSNGARIDLGKQPCYTLFNFTSAAAAQGFFTGINFVFGLYGLLKVVNVTGGGQQVYTGTPPNGTPPPASDDGVNTIYINYSYNWLNFASNPANNVTTGGFQLFNYLQAYNESNGTSLSTSQLAATILLHELGHLRFPNMDPMIDSAAFSALIYKDCVQ
jgi:RHS repeat-associated protein